MNQLSRAALNEFFWTQAAMSGADGVEFDVILTKDLVPILSHDFEAKDWGKPVPEVVDINKMNLVELQSGNGLLKLVHFVSGCRIMRLSVSTSLEKFE